MKLKLTFGVFMLCLSAAPLRAQDTHVTFSSKSISIVEKPAHFEAVDLTKFDLSLLDIYRAEQANNVVSIKTEAGEMIQFTLYSAEYCRANDIYFDEQLLLKGKMMGTHPTKAAHFDFEVTKGNKLEDKSTY